MLVVFHVVPVAAPGKAVLFKKAVTQVIFIDFIGECFAAIRIFFSGGGGHIDTVVPVLSDIGIVQRIDVNGQPVGMPGETGGAGHHPIVKTGGVVVLHG